MFRPLLAAAALILPALPAIAAEPVVSAHAGALAGRSPHQAYRTTQSADVCRAQAMHSLPAGKLPVYGTHAHGGNCGQVQVASRAASQAVHTTN